MAMSQRMDMNLRSSLHPRDCEADRGVGCKKLRGGHMKWSQLLFLGAMILWSSALGQAQQQCLHKDSDKQEQKERLQAVVAAVRILNTAEFIYQGDNKRFGTYDELLASPALNAAMARGAGSGAGIQMVTFRPNADIVSGFDLRVTTDGTKYNISVLDRTDPCKYSIFSSDIGIIYQGYPIQ